MNRYWIRIVLGALAIFLVGTTLYYTVRSGKRRVHQIADSDAPITIPLAFIPFKVDGHELGTLSRLQILRSAPKQVEAVNFRVKLADSVADERLGECILVVGEHGSNFDIKHVNANSVFSCATASDTTGKNLAPLGSIETQRGNTFVLFSDADALHNLDVGMNESDARADSISAVYEQMADSIQEMADSIRASAEQRADSMRAAAETKADSVRAMAGMKADSIRRAARTRSAPQPKPEVKVGP